MGTDFTQTTFMPFICGANRESDTLRHLRDRWRVYSRRFVLPEEHQRLKDNILIQIFNSEAVFGRT